MTSTEPKRSRRAAARAKGASAGLERLTREAWIAAAKARLVAGGVGAVRVEPLAAELGVTTGSFYWRFKDRNALLQALLVDWETGNTAPFEAAIARGAPDPHRQFKALIDVWIDETAYSPGYDSALRDWARTSADAEAVVRRVDERRIALFQQIYRGFGYPEVEAFVRARILYFHQVGYYALRIVEDRAARERLLPYYVSALGAASKA